MITTKQRAGLRRLANKLETIGQIGKNGIDSNTAQEALKALNVRELVKYRVLETAPVTAREAAQTIAQQTGAEIVQVIGTRFVLYKPKDKDPVIKI